MATASPKSGSLLASPGVEKAADREIVSDSIAAGVMFALVLTVGQRIVGFGRGILFCRLMTDQQLGQWSMVWSYFLLLAPLAVLGLPGCFGKFSEYFRHRGHLRQFVTRIGAISLVTTLLMSGTMFVFAEPFAWLLFRDEGQATLVRYLVVALIFVSASNFLSALMESLRQVRVVTIMRFLTGVLFAVIGTAMLMFWKEGASAATIGFAVSCGLGMIPAIWILHNYRIDTIQAKTSLTHSTMWRRIAPFAIWLWVSNLLNNLFEITDRYMLVHWSNTSSDLALGSVGQYHSGRVVPLLLVSVAAMLAGVLMPYLSQSWESGNKKKVHRQLNWTIKLVAVSFTLGGALILWLAPLLFDIILQGRYNDGLAIMPLTLVYCTWYSLMTIAQDYLWVAEKGKWATMATGFGLVANVGANMILIPIIGLQGAVMATAFGNATIVILIFALNHRFGCRADRGIWLSALVPLVLLLSPMLAIWSIIGIACLCHSTNLIFDAEEKTVIQQTVQAGMRKCFSRL